MAMPTIPAFTFLPAVYGGTIGLAATGFALLIARAFDVVTDPLIGAFSDRTATRWGRRKPWILVGAILSGYAILQLAHPPAQPTAAYLAVWSILLFVGWTLVQVPYTAWGAELSDDYHQRARVTAAREGMAVVGIVAAGAVPLIAAQSGRSEQDAFGMIAWLAVILGGPTILYMLWRVADPLPPPSIKPTGSSLRATLVSMRDVARNRPFARLLSAWFINGLANGIPASLFLIYLEHVLKADQAQRGILIPVYFVTAIAAIPLWLFISRHIGKHRTWCLAMIMTCAAFVWVPLLSPGDVVAFGIISAITGMGFGADVTLPPALQADVVDYDTLRHGKQRAGLLFALWSMATKLALAVAVGTVFPALEAFGFSTRGGNTAGTLMIVAVTYALIPVALKIIAIFLVWNFPITAKRQARIRKRLDARGA
ncbi:MAG: MFS transporter [Rhodospirillaceae bacterium]|nr:MFS transporter [Rhodospirillaceae bacterium]